MCTRFTNVNFKHALVKPQCPLKAIWPRTWTKRQIKTHTTGGDPRQL